MERLSAGCSSKNICNAAGSGSASMGLASAKKPTLADVSGGRRWKYGGGEEHGNPHYMPLMVRSDIRKDDAEDVDRRKLLLTTLAATVSFPFEGRGAHPAVAAPVQPPNLQQCKTPIINGLDCCLPVSTTITDFKLPINPTVHLRLPAHRATKEYIAQYEKAYQLLLKLPASDPRQFAQQANVHCAFCDSAYVENGTTIEYQVHNSWFFFPWHRWFLYFHERILGSVLKDPNFALPFWNWDAPSGSTLPPMYAPPSSALYDANRNPLHVPPAPVDLNYNLTESGRSTPAQIAANNALMYRQFVSGSKTPSLFFGQPLRQGGAANPGAGTVENVPHGTVHVWTGNPANANDEDMGALYSAARDPCFFAHHANLDRLWEVWKSLGGRRQDITDSDWLNATFLFYDENAKLVRVRIGDALDTKKLGYKYQDVPNEWVNKKPTISKSREGKKGTVTTPTKSKKGKKSTSSSMLSTTIDPNSSIITSNNTETLVFKEVSYPNGAPAMLDETANMPIINSGMAMEFSASSSHDRHSSSSGHHSPNREHEGLTEFKARESKEVDKALSILVKRPKKVRADDFEEEILVFEGVEVPSSEKVKFDVYINLTKEELEQVESEEGPERRGRCDIAEYAGSFFNVPHLGKIEAEPGKKVHKSNFKLGIGEVLRELGLEEVDSFIVTVVPRTSHAVPISVQDVVLEYE